MKTTRLTMAQALVRYLACQHVERDGAQNPFFAACGASSGMAMSRASGKRSSNTPPTSAITNLATSRRKSWHQSLLPSTAIAWPPSPAHQASVPARPIWSLARLSPPSTASPCSSCPATSSPSAIQAPVLQHSRKRAHARHQRQRLLQACLALLGSHQPPRAADRVPARSHARVDFASRYRRGDAQPAAGCASRSLRLSQRFVRAAHLAYPAQPTGHERIAASGGTGSAAASSPSSSLAGACITAMPMPRWKLSSSAAASRSPRRKPARARCYMTIRSTWARPA